MRIGEGTFARYHLAAAVFGTCCFVANLTLNTGWLRLLALVWVFAVPAWIVRYVGYRRARGTR